MKSVKDRRRSNAPGPESDDSVLVVQDLTVHFPGRYSTAPIRAVDGVSFHIRRGETLGLVGESGCGKSSLARAILRVYRPTAGAVWLRQPDSSPAEWHDLSQLSERPLRRLRRHAQMIFQDPYASLDPRMTVGAIVAEPLEVHRRGTQREIQRKVQALLEEVGLEARHVKRFPHEFSGGQRQRIGIARALALDPELILCDEPVSALDVSVASQVLNLLLELQERRALAYLFISHNLSVVRHVSHRIAVMYLGKVVETAPAAALYEDPQHPYTRALLAAVPIPNPDVERNKRTLQLSGEAAPREMKHGCAFAPRCPEVFAACRAVTPILGATGAEHRAACLLHDEAWPEGRGDSPHGHESRGE